MRTTLTIDDDIAQALKDLSRERGGTFKAVANEVLRRGLTTGEKPPAAREPFQVRSAPARISCWHRSAETEPAGR